MCFGIDECGTQNITKGKYACSTANSTQNNQNIQPLRKGEVYKYLGIQPKTKH